MKHVLFILFYSKDCTEIYQLSHRPTTSDLVITPFGRLCLVMKCLSGWVGQTSKSGANLATYCKPTSSLQCQWMPCNAATMTPDNWDAYWIYICLFSYIHLFLSALFLTLCFLKDHTYLILYLSLSSSHRPLPLLLVNLSICLSLCFSSSISLCLSFFQYCSPSVSLSPL